MTTLEKLKAFDWISVSAIEKICGIPKRTIQLSKDKPIPEKYIEVIEAEFNKFAAVCNGNLDSTTIKPIEPIIKEVIKEVIVEKIVYKDRIPGEGETYSEYKMIPYNKEPVKKEESKTIMIDGKEYTKIRISHHAGDTRICDSYPKGTTVYLQYPNSNERIKTKSDGIFLYIKEEKIDYVNFMVGFVATEIYDKFKDIKK